MRFYGPTAMLFDVIYGLTVVGYGGGATSRSPWFSVLYESCVEKTAKTSGTQGLEPQIRRVSE